MHTGIDELRFWGMLGVEGGGLHEGLVMLAELNSEVRVRGKG
jgi:hypothetical protein